MRITPDTKLLVRALVQDDPEQARAASALLEQDELIAIPLPVFCELVWVLRRVYRFAPSDCASAIEALIQTSGVSMDRPTVRAGLGLLAAGGDFAYGVISPTAAEPWAVSSWPRWIAMRLACSPRPVNRCCCSDGKDQPRGCHPDADRVWRVRRGEALAAWLWQSLLHRTDCIDLGPSWGASAGACRWRR